MKEGFARIVQFLTAEDADIFTALDGIQFLPVNKNVYLQVQSLINSTENAFEQIRHSAFIYKDHLVWSGLEQDEMRIMYKYISDGKRVGRISYVHWQMLPPKLLTNISAFQKQARIFDRRPRRCYK
jgi:hypothetical protein